MKHWHIDEVAWDRFDPSKVDPAIVPLVKAAAMVERNGDDYANYLCNVFHDDPDFSQAARYWAVEEVQHGEALGRWATLADPGWDYKAAFARFRKDFKIETEVDRSVRGSRTGELIARCAAQLNAVRRPLYGSVIIHPLRLNVGVGAATIPPGHGRSTHTVGGDGGI